MGGREGKASKAGAMWRTGGQRLTLGEKIQKETIRYGTV